MAQIQWPLSSPANLAAASGRFGAGNGGGMGKDQFLRILITQLQNQDPLSPLQDRDFIAQMAQFSALEQIMNMAEQIQLMRLSLGAASAMIGMEAEWRRPTAGGWEEEGSGIITAIHLREGRQCAEIGGELVDIEHIVSVRSVSGGDA